MAMATPIAHKGVIAGAKAVAFTVLDLLTTPQLISEAKAYFNNVQLKDQHYETLLSATDKPAMWINSDIMKKYREEMSSFYYDEARYDTYLDQLGIDRSEEHTSELQSLMRISYAVSCLQKKKRIYYSK